MHVRFTSAGRAILLLLAVGSLAQMAMRNQEPLVSGIPGTIPESSIEMVSYVGVAPTSISLSWTESTDPHFTRYVLQESTNSTNGPWVTVANILTKTTTTYYGSWLTPGGIEWWKVFYYNSTKSQISNTLQVTQPSVALLSYSQLNATSAQLTWNNNAAYGGLASFASYQLVESINGGPSTPVTTILDVNTLGYTLRDMTASTNYSFYLNTTDQCACSSSSPSNSRSNTLTINTPGPLSSSVIASPYSLDVGQRVSFSCTGEGGTFPYSYSWEFGDGSTAVGASSSHIYTSPATVTVTCTVTDSLRTIANSALQLTISPNPSITSFTASPTNVALGEKTTFVIVTSSGYGPLSYSYSNLPSGCLSVNATVLSCTPTSTGNYEITVTVTDKARESVTSTVRIVVTPPKILGLPRAVGLMIILASALGIGVVAIFSTIFALHRRR